MARPDRVRIQQEPEPDDRFHYVGRSVDGKQFMAFVTGAFEFDPHHGGQRFDGVKRWVAVLHLFAPDGSHLATSTRLGGFDQDEGRSVAGGKAWDQFRDLFQDAGITEAEQCDISVGLFQVVQDGVLYGLLYEGNNEGDVEGDEHVMLEPNDIMFHPPWDGTYSS